jgi:hypothetical protein
MGYVPGMRKFGLLLAGLVGFLLGSRAGREPYERLERQLSRLRAQPEVQDVMDTVQGEVGERATDLTDKVKSKVSSSSKEQSSGTPTNESPSPKAHASL